MRNSSKGFVCSYSIVDRRILLLLVPVDLFHAVDGVQLLVIYQRKPSVVSVADKNPLELATDTRQVKARTTHSKSVGRARRCGRFDSPVRQGSFLPESVPCANYLTLSVQPSFAIACIDICMLVEESKHWQLYPRLDAR